MWLTYQHLFSLYEDVQAPLSMHEILLSAEIINAVRDERGVLCWRTAFSFPTHCTTAMPGIACS